MGIDAKYGKVTTEFGNIPDDEPVIVFRARDEFLPKVLNTYYYMCYYANCAKRHLTLIKKTEYNVAKWREENETLIRKPSSEGSKAWMKE